ncbi:hypothetical protein [Corynebacterium pacaense]|uniref:hypothetical protein n=1 Tax=Corynebacterium pacaense TaxID=1816684 RepID=UPI001178AFE7|nr:hypothetical protein [Corynebacterium pacaense]
MRSEQPSDLYFFIFPGEEPTSPGITIAEEYFRCLGAFPSARAADSFVRSYAAWIPTFIRALRVGWLAPEL